jgi:hypothetical protein
MKRIVLAVATVAVAMIATTPGVAAAGPGPTPDGGLTGACNMTNANATPGMNNAINQSLKTTANGVNGMIIAIVNSDGGTAQSLCPPPQ